MYKVTKYPHGTLSWADSTSTDAAAAKQFYIDLMGWGFDDMPMGENLPPYTMFKQDGAHVAAISQQMESHAGMPSVWNNYISVDDVDALVSKVTELGGTVIAEPMDVFDSGRMMVVQDPTGAFISLWQPKNHIGAGLVNTTGAMCWNELITTDTTKARAFYGDLLGWTFDESDGYITVKNNGRANAGIMAMPDGAEMPSSWMVYFAVDDAEKAAARITELGGTIHMPPTDAGGVGKFVMAADPAGAVFYVIAMAQPGDPWIEA